MSGRLGVPEDNVTNPDTCGPTQLPLSWIESWSRQRAVRQHMCWHPRARHHNAFSQRQVKQILTVRNVASDSLSGLVSMSPCNVCWALHSGHHWQPASSERCPGAHPDKRGTLHAPSLYLRKRRHTVPAVPQHYGNFVKRLYTHSIEAKQVASTKITSRFRGSSTLRCRRLRRLPPADGLSSRRSLHRAVSMSLKLQRTSAALRKVCLR